MGCPPGSGSGAVAPTYKGGEGSDFSHLVQDKWLPGFSVPQIQYSVTLESVKYSLPDNGISSSNPSLTAVFNLDKGKADRNSSLGIDSFF